MRLHGIVEIHKTAQLFLTMFRVVKLLFVVPHFHNRPDYPFGFAVGLRAGGTGEFLVDTVFKTGHSERMVGCAFVFAAVVRINTFDQIRTGFDDLLFEKLGRTLGGFVRQYGGVKLA